jgi:ribokinase
MNRSIVVVGSLNMDFVVRVGKLPLPGQTVSGQDFTTLPGGKGGNQAYAAGKLGGRVRMLGRVGDDVFGEKLRSSLDSVDVDTTQVLTTRGAPSGVALIFVEESGQNEIVVAPGANSLVTTHDVQQGLAGIEEGFLLLQLESPLKAVLEAAKWVRSHRHQVILDPAPAQPLESELLNNVDILTPNETEALSLLGESGNRVDLTGAAQVAKRLHRLGPAQVILKLGEHGVWYSDGSTSRHFPGRRVVAVDVTAAGDTFNGALAVALAEGQTISQAIQFANIAASISVTRPGAQPSVPARSEVDALLPK